MGLHRLDGIDFTTDDHLHDAHNHNVVSRNLSDRFREYQEPLSSSRRLNHFSMTKGISTMEHSSVKRGPRWS
jgi:hypothetical protein